MTDVTRNRAVQHYATARPDLEKQLEFFVKLWALQDSYVPSAAEYTPATEEASHRALNQHQTLLSLVQPQIPLDAYRDAVDAVAKLVAEEAGLPEDQAAALGEVALGAAVFEESLEGALSGFDAFVRTVVDSLADDRLTDPLIAFVLTEALTPYLAGAAKSAVSAAGTFDWLQWDSGLCPACGTPASSGIIRDSGELQGGRRWLSCPLCRTQWEYARIRCVRCGTRNHTHLEYLFDEEDPGHRVHICKKCHGYGLVSFEKELHQICQPEVEEIVMVRLEPVAAERGYTPLGDDVAEVAN